MTLHLPDAGLLFTDVAVITTALCFAHLASVAILSEEQLSLYRRTHIALFHSGPLLPPLPADDCRRAARTENSICSNEIE
jgi:hypothetical protein